MSWSIVCLTFSVPIDAQHTIDFGRLAWHILPYTSKFYAFGSAASRCAVHLWRSQLWCPWWDEFRGFPAGDAQPRCQHWKLFSGGVKSRVSFLLLIYHDLSNSIATLWFRRNTPAETGVRASFDAVEVCPHLDFDCCRCCFTLGEGCVVYLLNTFAPHIWSHLWLSTATGSTWWDRSEVAPACQSSWPMKKTGGLD